MNLIDYVSCNYCRHTPVLATQSLTYVTTPEVFYNDPMFHFWSLTYRCDQHSKEGLGLLFQNIFLLGVIL